MIEKFENSCMCLNFPVKAMFILSIRIQRNLIISKNYVLSSDENKYLLCKEKIRTLEFSSKVLT